LTKKVIKKNCEKKVYKKKYFGQEEEDWILKFNRCKDKKRRNRIYEKHIHAAFKELVNNLVNVYKMGNIGRIDVIRHECMSHLFIKLCNGNFNGEAGSKAFSYFNVIARNFMFQKYKDHKLKGERESNEDCLTHAEELKNSTDYKLLRGIECDSNFESDIIKEDERVGFIRELQEVKTRVKEYIDSSSPDKSEEIKKNCSKVIDATCELFKQADSLPSLKKKTIYFFIKEITGLDAKDITGSFKILKIFYPEMSMVFVK
jgi:hypothetical protein